MHRITLVLAVVFTFLLVTPTLAQQWQTFYLIPSDPHWVKKVDPKGRLIETKDRWISDSIDFERRPQIYFMIPELDDKGGYIKFWYAREGEWNLLSLYASKDGTEYVKLWKSYPLGSTGKTKVTVKIPPGYKYFYFIFTDGNMEGEKLILWKEIQFKTFGAPAPTPTPPSSPQLGIENSDLLITSITIAVVALTVARLKKTRSKKV